MWPTYFTGTQILAGDWVRIFVPNLGLWHHGIVRQVYWIGTGFAVEIAHNMKQVGVITSDWYEFANDQHIFLHRRDCDQGCVQEILSRVEFNLGKPYLLFAQNCEHFASFAFSGKAESSTVRTAASIAVGTIILALLG